LASAAVRPLQSAHRNAPKDPLFLLLIPLVVPHNFDTSAERATVSKNREGLRPSRPLQERALLHLQHVLA